MNAGFGAYLGALHAGGGVLRLAGEAVFGGAVFAEGAWTGPASRRRVFQAVEIMWSIRTGQVADAHAARAQRAAGILFPCRRRPIMTATQQLVVRQPVASCQTAHQRTSPRL
jgi:hypothetical protein